MTKKIYQLALFGHPVAHSLSPKIHQQFAKQFGIKIDYQLIDTEPENFLQAVTAFFHAGGHGANVTLPHKTDAMNVVSHISKIAEISKAVNTLSLDKNNHICGDNTDGYGFIIDLKKRCQFNCENKKILILGSGGATQGIVPAILTQKPECIIIVNRTLSNAQKIARYKKTKAITFEQLNQLETSFDLIIHSSSLGHLGKTLKFKKQHGHEKTIAYDLSYGKAAIPFQLHAKKQGVIKTYDGIGMLIEQAAKSFEIWFDKNPTTNKIRLN